jgi:NYN domain
MSAMRKKVNLFWDNSNIYIVGQAVCDQKEPLNKGGFRIHFPNMLNFARDGREIEYAYVGGSIPPETDSIWSIFRDLGVNVDKQERGQLTGGEIAVDQSIQLQMANCIIDHDEPQIMVLLTGDGSGYDLGKGFLKQLERAKKKGWEIEVVSWDKGCNKRLMEFAKQNGKYRSLEKVYNRVSFIANGRKVL